MNVISDGRELRPRFLGSVVNPVVLAWDSHSDLDGRHIIDTNEPFWRGPITVVRGETVFQILMNWLARTWTRSLV